MAKFLFTMLTSNDLGLPTRLVPIARVLSERGHDVVMFNPAPAPARLIADAALNNLEAPPFPVPKFGGFTHRGRWDVEDSLVNIYGDFEFVWGATKIYVDALRAYRPDVVVDSFGVLACLAARILDLPLVSVFQGNFHPASRFTWWEEVRPTPQPNAPAAINKVAGEYGLAPVARCVDLLNGDLSLVVGTPETDPLPADAHVTYVGPIVWQSDNAALPEWLARLTPNWPLIWVYSGNPRYVAGVSTPFDSIAVIRAVIASLANLPMHVVLTTGYQELPKEFGELPSNFHHVAYLPGIAMAKRCDLMIHPGGHSSVMTGLFTGTPAVIVPTSTERESNARRYAALGAGELLLPTVRPDGEKEVDAKEFAATVRRVLDDPNYLKSAVRIAESMRKFGGAVEAANKIEGFATNLLK